VYAPAAKLEVGWKPRVIPKDADAKARIHAVVDKNILFRGLGEVERNTIVDAMERKNFRAGDVIIRQGDAGDFFYVVESGYCEIFIQDVGKVAESREGGAFGELALMYNAPRAATVIATDDTATWALDQQTFKKTVMGLTMQRRQRHKDLLSRVKILAGLDDYERSTIADALTEQTYEAEDVIIKEGDPGTELFFIESGEVACTKEGVEGEVSRRLGAGDYVGERALLNSAPRAATVCAKKHTVCQVLDRATFTRVLGPLADTFRRNMSLYEQFKEDLHEAKAADEDEVDSDESA
jgi:cAMP-dependent protein kinase regulator